MTLPIPPVVGQNVAKLPDGSLDPAHATDCGEACLSSALRACWGMNLTPGCIRQSLGLGEGDGSSSAEMLRTWWELTGRKADTTSFGPSVLWSGLAKLRHYGRYAMLLGNWVDPSVLHWVLAYERGTAAVSVMGPWGGGYYNYSFSHLEQYGAGQQVWLH